MGLAPQMFCISLFIKYLSNSAFFFTKVGVNLAQGDQKENLDTDYLLWEIEHAIAYLRFTHTERHLSSNLNYFVLKTLQDRVRNTPPNVLSSVKKIETSI